MSSRLPGGSLETGTHYGDVPVRVDSDGSEDVPGSFLQTLPVESERTLKFTHKNTAICTCCVYQL